MNDALIDRINRFCSRSGYQPSTVSRLIFNDGKTYERLMAGKPISSHLHEKAKTWFRENARRKKRGSGTRQNT